MTETAVLSSSCSEMGGSDARVYKMLVSGGEALRCFFMYTICPELMLSTLAEPSRLEVSGSSILKERSSVRSRPNKPYDDCMFKSRFGLSCPSSDNWIFFYAFGKLLLRLFTPREIFS